ncbi:hypothetical protein IJO12_08795 [bacterium]|nr:hypothetical protein [bacterium]
MTITLLDLYNMTASQEWVMYDNDAVSTDEMEISLVVAINKAIIDILASYDFPFRERTHLILTIPNVDTYLLPNGLIKQDSNGDYCVRYNSQLLAYSKDFLTVNTSKGLPEKFGIKNDKIILSPVPLERGLMAIDYSTLAIGENSAGEEIFALKNADDKLYSPPYLEELMKEAVITRTVLNTLAAEKDENYSAYKKQADKAYKLLIKYSKGVWSNKKIKI